MKNAVSPYVTTALTVIATLLSALNGLAADSTATAHGAAESLSEATSLLSSIFKVAGSLVFVVMLMLLLLYVIRRSGLGKGLTPGSSLITVLESRMVAPKKYIAIVEIAGKCLAVGITDTSINMLTDIDNGIKETPADIKGKTSATAKTGPFANLLKKSLRSVSHETKSAALPEDQNVRS